MENKETPYNHFKRLSISHVKTAILSKKNLFDFSDTIKHKDFASERFKCIIDAIVYIDSKPLRDNDYFKYLNCFIIHNKKLDEKYFRHDLEKLNQYYIRAEKEKTNPFSIANFESYVLFMFLKLRGNYLPEDDTIFNVQIKDNREYNPLTKIPSVLRGTLPFEVKEYDIKRAFPSFIDIELETDFRLTIYDKISKSNFAKYLNSNVTNNITIEQARKELTIVYNGKTNKVITDERFNEKGRAFKDFVKYESDYIKKFVFENNLTNYVRLHDGIFVLKNVECETVSFGKVEFSIKECIKPKIENSTISFYETDFLGRIQTSQSMYADFLKQEKFIRIESVDDKIQLLKNTNNVIDYFNHKTDMVSFLENEINEGVCDGVRNSIARDNTNILFQSYHLLKPIELIYYKDNKTRFGLPFLNGFFYFDEIDQFVIKSKDYSQVNGFFSPHQTQKREFEYTNQKGNFETFIERICTGEKEFNSKDEVHTYSVKAFNSMIGYLVHNYKSFTESPCIVLTDEGANDEHRNGRRGKTLISIALQNVTKTMVKGGNEYRSDYIHNFADLDKSYNLYLLDDIPASFNFNDLYTNITGGINIQPKGTKGVWIQFEDSPKFLMTSNWLLRYDEKNASTNSRFIEYKVKPYYNSDFTPKDEFNHTFFEDWDLTEWSKFYSYIFRCVHSYLKDGLTRITYDKTIDNYLVAFGSEVKESEMARILDELINIKESKSFTVSDVLSVYNRFDNPLLKEKFFTHRNSRDLINTYLQNLKENRFIYNSSLKKWFKE
ncbi:MAG: hypothetical protein K9G37_11965 [Crocinitomicaceae bacterium]|nr:hypothetical protein [Crocinitomicaceae bacterium]